MKNANRYTYISLICCLFLCAQIGFATTVLTINDLKEKIVQGSVKEVYVSDVGIEGQYIDQGIDTPFIVFNKSTAFADDVLKLAKEHGVRHGFKHVVESRNSNVAYKALFLQIAGLIVYLGILVGIFINLLSMNKKITQIILLLRKNINKTEK